MHVFSIQLPEIMAEKVEPDVEENTGNDAKYKNRIPTPGLKQESRYLVALENYNISRN